MGKPATDRDLRTVYKSNINSEFSPNGNVQIDAMIYVLAHEVNKKELK